jgi:hypothetical protein
MSRSRYIEQAWLLIFMANAEYIHIPYENVNIYIYDIWYIIYIYNYIYIYKVPQVVRMLDTSTEQNQVAAQVFTAPACFKAEASAACCMSSCNFKFKSCQKQSQTTCHQETRDKSPLDSPRWSRCPQDKSWIHELLMTIARVLVNDTCLPSGVPIGSWHLCVLHTPPGLLVL